MKYVIALLIVNSLLALAHVIFAKKRGVRALFEGVIIFACPIVAPLFYLISSLAYRAVFSKREVQAYLGFDKHAEKALSVPDVDRDMNIVPIEEAMLVSDTAELRKMMLNLLKTGGDSVIGAVSMALESDDGETAHYSASAVADSLAGFQRRCAEYAESIEKKPGSAPLLCEYIEYLINYLKCGLISGKETGMYVDKAVSALDSLITADKAEASDAYFRDITMLYIGAGDIEKARQTAARAWLICPETLGGYYARLNVMYAESDYEGFKKCLEQLKKSDVPIDRRTLDIIRALSQ